MSSAQRKPRKAPTVRRSVALPGALVDMVREVGPAEHRDNLNRLVTIAMEEYVVRRKEQEFESAMADMAADPEIRAECGRIAKEFRRAELDGIDSRRAKARVAVGK